MSNIEFTVMRCGECDLPLGVIPSYLAAYADTALLDRDWETQS